jgi:hypothetical protein
VSWSAGPKGKPFYDVFLARVIRIGAVQRERAAAIKEARGARAAVLEYERRVAAYGDLLSLTVSARVAAIEAMRRELVRPPEVFVSEEDAELFFDSGIIPGFGPGEARSPLWPINTAPIDPPEHIARVSPALLRALVAALEEWQRLVRELRRGGLIVTGEKLSSVMTIYDDRRKIGSETWLSEGLCFDVRATAICEIKRNVGFGSSLVKLWDDLTVQETGSIDWDDLRLELVARRDRGELPSESDFVDYAKALIRDLYGATVNPQSESELRRLVRPLYGSGSVDDLKRKRRK